MIDLAWSAWVVLVVAALLIGLAKTALPGLATLSVALFAAVLPARSSTVVMLCLLLVGDLIAVWTYRRDVDLAALRRLIPAVVVGLAAGGVLLALADDVLMRRIIGAILLALIAITVLLLRTGKLSPNHVLGNPAIRGAYGTLGGFTTMAANAGGPVMTLYFLAARFDVVRFLGTQAWFFFAVNLAKLPFSLGLGLLSIPLAGVVAALAPLVILGAFVGRRIVSKLDQRLFDSIVLGLTALSALYLLR